MLERRGLDLKGKELEASKEGIRGLKSATALVVSRSRNSGQPRQQTERDIVVVIVAELSTKY